jgi:hypothetical protein
MKPVAAVLFLLIASSAPFAQKHPNEAVVQQKFKSGSNINMRLEAGDYTISGSEATDIVVTYRAATPEKLRGVRVEIKSGGSGAELSVHNTPHNDFHALIEVPRHSDLWVRLSAGDLNIQDVEGNKDIESHAGDVEIVLPHPEEYGHRDGSVLAGSIDASAFSVSKDGLFRSFRQEGSGKYSFHAHLWAGDLTIRPASL